MTDNYKGKWLLGDKIGNGGQGTVYRTRDSNGKTYAIKVVKVKPADKKKLQRIKTEIEIVKQLKDEPNIIRVYDDNVADLKEDSSETQEVYYVMDFAEYGNLQQNDFYLSDIELSLRLFSEILKGVDAAHKVGVIHRDLKPENILLYPTQRSIAVSDFGLGLLADDTKAKHVTDSDEILGPRHFMSPEQYKDPSKANEKSDIYSLGKIFYFLLTGKGKVFREEIGDITKEFSGTNPYLPLVQEKLLNKMVAYDSKNRFDSVSEAMEDVESILKVISGNSQRFIKKRGKSFSVYDLVVAGRRQEFINDFFKDLARNMDLLEWVVSELVRDDKQVLLEQLKSELLAKYTKGKAHALIEATFLFVEKPEDLKKQESGRYTFASYFLAKYFEDADSHKLAHEYILKTLAKETDPSLSLTYLLLFSEICKKCPCNLPHDFDQRIIALLRATADIDEKAKLYKIVGEHYMEIGQKSQGLRFLEAYLEIKPHDNSVRFDCAHAYSNLSQPSLALHHYLLHRKTEKKTDSGRQNNLGVLYENNGMEIKSMEMYRAAYDEGNTLAGSNIASQYLSVGLVKEAEDILRSIIANNTEYDERVDTVLGGIGTQKANEEEAHKKLEEHGTLINRHNIDSVSTLSKPAYDWIGFWNLDIGPVLELKLVKGVITASVRNGDKKVWDLKFEGNMASIVKVEIGYETYKFGILYFVNQNHFEGYLLKDGKEPKEVVGKRITDIEEFDKQQQSSISTLLGLNQNLLGK